MLAQKCDECKFISSCFYSLIDISQTKQKWNTYRKIISFNDHSKVYNEGDKADGVYVVCCGRVKMYKSFNGSGQILTSIKKPGSIFGYEAICKEYHYSCDAITMGNTNLNFIKKEYFLDMLLNDNVLMFRMIKILCLDIDYLQLRLLNIAYQSSDKKIADVLLNHISYSTKTSKTPIVYNLKRTEIAELCGLRIETVVRTLAKFEKEKIIKRKINSIEIIQPHKLMNISKK